MASQPVQLNTLRRFSSVQVDIMRRWADALVLRDAYEVWYDRHGWPIEQQLLDTAKQLAAASQDAKVHELLDEAISFADVLHPALKLVAEDGNHSMLDICKRAIRQHPDVHADAFLELHTHIQGLYGCNRETPSKEEFYGAVGRQLQYTQFAQQLADFL